MARQTELLINPTLDEVKRQAAVMKLPAREAEKFFWYWESVGWRRGRTKLKSWVGAMHTWRLNWEERNNVKRRDQEASTLDHELNERLKKL